MNDKHTPVKENIFSVKSWELDVAAA